VVADDLDGLPSWDESARPLGRGYPEATPQELARGEHLRLIHDMYRRGLAQVAEVLDQVRSGQIQVGEARAAVHVLGVRVSFDQLGTFCGQLCRSVETHHSIEDVHLYPALRAASDDLTPVLDRLDLEHRVIHEVLERFDEVLVRLARSGDDGLPGVHAHFEHLRALLESHFRYEEEQIGTALAVHDVGI
jgi:hypothetical protein